MAFGSALVDRARVVSRVPTGRRVEGASQFAVVHGEWFRARLTLPAPMTSTVPDAPTREVVKSPTLLFGKRDQNGNTFEVTVEDRIEVDSKAYGKTLFVVTADPEAFRRKRSILGFQVTLRQVVAHEFSRLDHERAPVGARADFPYARTP